MFWAFGSWLEDKAKEFGGIEERMLLRAENARLRLALAPADDLPELPERAERILAAFNARDPPTE